MDEAQDISAQIEHLRIRYRDQAIKAVEEADKKGFERGKYEYAENLKAADDEAKKWKSIALALGSGVDQAQHHQQQQPQSLIKYVMEQVYRDIKKEWEAGGNQDDTAEVVGKIKVCRGFEIFITNLSTNL